MLNQRRVCGLFVLIVVGLFSTFAWAQPAEQRRQRGGQRGRITWDSALQRADANKDGKLTRDEFPGPPQAFDRMDGDGDGIVTKQEFEKNMGNRRGAPDGAQRGEAGRFGRFQEFPTADPAPGSEAPEFELKTPGGKLVSLAQLLKSKPVVLEFGSFT